MRTKKIETKITINKLSHEGRGIGDVDGKVAFIDEALPGETVLAQLTRCKSRYVEGQALDILENPSPLRTTPKCPHFGVCGGCRLQHIAPEAQLDIKQQAFKEQLEQAGLGNITWLPALKSATWGYRHKARLGVKYVPGKEKALVGFREKNGRYVANLDTCEVLHPNIGHIIDKLSTFITTLAARDAIPQLEIAVADSANAVIIRHLAALSDEDTKAWLQFAAQHHLKLYSQAKGIESIKPLIDGDEAEIYYDLASFDCRFYFYPWQFTQVNPDINNQMVQQAIDWLALNDNDRVLDLFCGIGNFSLPLAKHVQQVVGVEGDELAVSQAKKNASINGISNAEFHVANLFEPIDELAWHQQNFDKILIDPPRAGCKEILRYFKAWQAKKIVYVSCNPATFVRDAATLQQLGFSLKQVGVMDMFPHTQHLEVMGLFEGE